MRRTGHALFDRARLVAPHLHPDDFSYEVPPTITEPARQRLSPAAVPGIMAMIDAKLKAEEDARRVAALAAPTATTRQMHGIDEHDPVFAPAPTPPTQRQPVPRGILPPAALHETGSFPLPIASAPASPELPAAAPQRELDAQPGKLQVEERIALDATRGVQAAQRLRAQAATAANPTMSRLAEILANAAEDASFGQQKVAEQAEDAARQAAFTAGGGWWGGNAPSQVTDASPAPTMPPAIEAPVLEAATQRA